MKLNLFNSLNSVIYTAKNDKLLVNFYHQLIEHNLRPLYLFDTKTIKVTFFCVTCEKKTFGFCF